MTEPHSERLDEIEKKIQALQTATQTKRTPVAGIALFVGAIVFIVIMANCPLPGVNTNGSRIFLGIVAFMVAGALYACAHGLVAFGLKALVEIAGAVLWVLTALAGVLIWASAHPLKQALIEDGLASRENAMLIVVISAVVGLFLFNMIAFLLLYPLSKIAGTQLVD